jgi:serine/threonine protein kinase
MDIQPNNVMFATRRSWLLKVIDFERAVSLDGAESPKKPDPKTVNPEWSAPELLKPEAPLSEQVDIWGLGAIAFCL